MKKMVVMVLAAGFAACMSAQAFSQERPSKDPVMGRGMGHPRGMMEHHGKGFLFGDPDRMQKLLGLTDEQVDRIAEINDQFRKEHAAVMDKIGPKARALRKVLRAENVDLDKARALLKEIGDFQVESRIIRIRHWLEIEKLLNPEQRRKLRDERPCMDGPMMKGPGPEGAEE